MVGDEPVDTVNYTVKQYAESAIAIENSKAEADRDNNLIYLLESILWYGGHSQIQFDKNTDLLASADLTGSDPSVIVDSNYLSAEGALPAPETIFDQSGFDDLKVTGASLVLESETTLRLFLSNVNGVDLNDYSFAVFKGDVPLNSDRYEVVTEGNGAPYIAIKNIAAAELDESFKLTITKTAASQTNTVQYAPLNYAKAVLDHSDAYTVNHVNVVKALCMYNVRANSYFNR